MRTIFQRVKQAHYKTPLQSLKIKNGLVLFVSFHTTDTIETIEWMCRKLLSVKVYKKWSLNIVESGFEIMIFCDKYGKSNDIVDGKSNDIVDEKSNVIVDEKSNDKVDYDNKNDIMDNEKNVYINNNNIFKVDNENDKRIYKVDKNIKSTIDIKSIVDTTSILYKDIIENNKNVTKLILNKEKNNLIINKSTDKLNTNKFIKNEYLFNEFCKCLIKLYRKDKIQICVPDNESCIEIINDGPYTSIIDRIL